MNRIRKTLAAGFLALAVLAVVFAGGTFSSFAATGKITFSDPSVTVGNQVSVTMKITTADGNLGSSDVMVTYDASALEFVSGTNANGGAGQIRVVGSMESTNQTTFSFTLKFKALKAGNTALTIASQEVYDADSRTVSITHVGSSSVTVNAPQGSSQNADLASLTISPGELSPAFSADVTEYTAVISGSSLAVSAPAADSNATVSVSGNDSLQNGENTVVCKVTAEDGTTTKSYTITVTVTEGGAEETGETESVPADAPAVDSGDWTIAESFDESLLPEGFTLTETEYNGQTVQAGTDGNGLLLLYMTDADGNGDFFYYDTESGTVSPYVTVLMAEKTIVVLPKSAVPEGTTLPEGFTDCTIDIGTHTVEGWIWGDGSETPEYCVVYGMNADGERNFYRYDQKEMTLQRFFTDPDAEDTRAKLTTLAEEYNSLVIDFNTRGLIIAVLFGACIILIILLIILLLTRRPRGGRRADYEEDDVRETSDFRGNRADDREAGGRGALGHADRRGSRFADEEESCGADRRGSRDAGYEEDYGAMRGEDRDNGYEEAYDAERRGRRNAGYDVERRAGRRADYEKGGAAADRRNSRIADDAKLYGTDLRNRGGEADETDADLGRYRSRRAQDEKYYGADCREIRVEGRGDGRRGRYTKEDDLEIVDLDLDEEEDSPAAGQTGRNGQSARNGQTAQAAQTGRSTQTSQAASDEDDDLEFIDLD